MFSANRSHQPEWAIADKIFARHGKGRIPLISSPLKVSVYETDLIVLRGFADGHELALHVESARKKSRRFIAIDGTSQPDTAQAPSVMAVIQMFLRKNPKWLVVSHIHETNGLTILSRHEWDKLKLPAKITMAKNVAQAAAKHIADGST